MYPKKIECFIDGQWRAGSDGRRGIVINPASGEEIGTVAHVSSADLDDALAAADRAFASWRNVPAWTRGTILRSVADLLRARAGQLATLLTLEQGKPLSEAKAEILAAAEVFDWCSEETKRSYGRTIPARGPGIRQIVTREPIGPAALFAPWNFPVVLSARKIAAALAAGCTCIVKPPEETPAAVAGLVQACADAGVPAGAINLVFGIPEQISEHLIRSPIVRKVSFTGSTWVGRHLAILAAEGLKKCTLELGGHAPAIVFEDADVDHAVSVLAKAKFRNAGQVCVAPSRFFVHEFVYAEFLHKLCEATNALKVGDGMAEGTDVGPLANARQLAAIESGVGDAQAKGAKLAAGGERVGNRGFFYRPTILTDVPDDATLMSREPFGPVALLNRFTSYDAVIAQANALPFGLAGYAFTSSLAKADCVSRDLKVGMAGVNMAGFGLPETPVCGINDSGYGHEGGIEGMAEYEVTKFIAQTAR